MASTSEAAGTVLAAPAKRADEELWIVEPRAPGVLARLREVLRYRHLFVYFARDILLKLLRQSPLAWIWLIMRSGAPAFVTAFVFGAIARFSSGDVPYLLFILVGTMCWQTFEWSLLMGTRAMRSYARLLTALYFPRIILLPVSTIEPMIRTAIKAGLILIAGGYYLYADGRMYLQAGPQLTVAAGALVSAWLLGIAFGLFTSVIEAPARDLRYSIRYLSRFWMFLTPVIYPLSMVPEQYRWIIALNPMTGLVEAFRWGVLGPEAGGLHPLPLAISAIALVVVGVTGLLFFGRAESKMVDAL
jgi:lipopolysaccharide transport system permease protein